MKRTVQCKHVVCPVFPHITLFHRDGIEHQMHFIAARHRQQHSVSLAIIIMIISPLISLFDIEYFWLNNAFKFKIMFFFEVVGLFLLVVVLLNRFQLISLVRLILISTVFFSALRLSHRPLSPNFSHFFRDGRNFFSGWMHNNDDENWYK